jgi:HEAT repeat protein
MNLPNKKTSELLGKDKNKAEKAAQHIINNADIEAWKCLIDNSDYLFSHIKAKTANLISKSITKDNIENVFLLLQYHSSDWDECIMHALAKFSDDSLNKRVLELLKSGSQEEKAYAAKYFYFVDYSESANVLFETAKSDYQPLTINSAQALGKLKDQFSYNFFIERLNSEDDWEKIEAAQFLAHYGDKEAVIPMLKAMSQSNMGEHIAGEICSLVNIHDYFENSDYFIQLLSLEAFDNILSGLAEVWTLSAILDFKIYETLENLIKLANSQPECSLSGKYAQLLLKAKSKVILFMENSQYTFDEEKPVISELEEIFHLLLTEGNEFWDKQVSNINKELIVQDQKRKLSAISVICELELENSLPYLVSMLSDKNESDVVICEAVLALSKMKSINNIDDIDSLISRIEDKNIAAIINSAR